MRKNPYILLALYCFFLLTGRVYGVGEKVLTLGSASSWDLVEKKLGVIEAPMIRPHPVLVLSESDYCIASPDAPGKNSNDFNSTDFCLVVDERSGGCFRDSQGFYDVSVSAELKIAASPFTRTGNAAAMFSGSPGAPIVARPGKNALFSSGSLVRDFSIEFWLYPETVENGAQILLWTSLKSDGNGGMINQRVQCVTIKNRYQWTFGDFFFSPVTSIRGEANRKSLTFTGPAVLPRTWSHHLIRFDADLGLLEYLVNGSLEALNYTTSTGREGGEVYTPFIGEDGKLALGSSFSGIIDGFRIYRSFMEKTSLAKYPNEGGRMESRTLDLGSTGSQILKIEAFGGRTANAGGKIRNEYLGNNPLFFQDHTEIKFSVRTSDSPYRWNDVPWIPVRTGTDLSQKFRGRYMQIAADFYPGWDGESSPYLAELKVIYSTAEPPPPPAQVTAAANDGFVELSWRNSPSRDVGGYMVYYGTARGEYFGNYAILGSEVRASPIDVGNRTSVRIEGLKNGTLYFFAVAAYRKQEFTDGSVMIISEPGRQVVEPGEFSREVAARPLRTAE